MADQGDGGMGFADFGIGAGNEKSLGHDVCALHE
jgi:hypothetical protein